MAPLVLAPSKKRHYALHLLFPSLGARLRLCFTGNEGVPPPEPLANAGGEYLVEYRPLRPLGPVTFSLFDDSLSLRDVVNALKLGRGYKPELRDSLFLLPTGVPMPVCKSPLTRRGMELTGMPEFSSLLLGR
jgi:hypothetical protein